MFQKILFVCLGNICRSPMAEGLFIDKVQKSSIQGLEIDSAGTSAYHVGERPDSRMIATAQSHGVHLPSRARQISRSDIKEFDLILAMDKSNYRDIIALCENEEEKSKIKLMRDFDDQNPGADVPDPYFGGDSGFEEVYQILDRSGEKLLSYIQA